MADMRPRVDAQTLDDAAREAQERHDRLLHHKVLELVLGAMVEMDGIEAVKAFLRFYLRQLEEF